MTVATIMLIICILVVVCHGLTFEILSVQIAFFFKENINDVLMTC